MKIKSLEATWVRIPLHKQYDVQARTYQDSSHIVVKIKTDEGIIGIGECPAVSQPNLTMEAISAYLGPSVIGMDPRQPDLLHQKMDAALADYNMAKCSIDVAAYDIWGKATGLPIAALLGGQHRSVIPVCDAIGILPAPKVASAAKQIVRQGFSQVKLKAGRDFNRDLEMVCAVRAACGSDLQIRIDINTGYRNGAIALPLCRRLEDAGVDIFEQPVLGSDLGGMAMLCDNLVAPVLAHESLATLEDAIAILDQNAADILNVSPPKAGGLYKAMQIVRLAEAHNVPVMIAGAMETGPGNMASAHLGAACREQPFPGDARTVLREVYSLVKEPILFESGHIRLPDRPGLGVTIDDDAIDKCQQTPWIKVG